jgi:nitrogen fixation/metabolism regulation signal transduction histidine kinase
VLGLISLLLFAVVLFLLVRAVVSRPLARATEAASRIAQGDLDVHLEIDNKDEIGLVLRSLNNISDNLSGVVGQVRRAPSRSPPHRRKSPRATWTCRAAPKSRPPAWKKPPPRWKN